MKQIYIFMVLLLLGSCSLDQHDSTRLDYDNITTKSDIGGVRNGAYSMARYLYSGTNAYRTDYATDLFTELVNAGARGVFFSTLTLSAQDGDVQTIWDDTYRTISRINTFLDNVDNVTDSDEEVAQWRGEMYLLRAMMYRELAIRFCKDYEPSSASSDYGVPLITSYNVEYAGGARGTLEQTYAQILEDIASAEGLLLNEGLANATYLTTDCITALKAQVALDMHDYANAVTYADKIISGGKYTLSSSQAQLATLWGGDNSSEIIFEFALELSNLNPESDYTSAIVENTDMSFVDMESGSRRVSVAPCGWLAKLYKDNAATDWRWGVYASEGEIVGQAGVSSIAVYLNKFDGSDDLMSYYSRPKVFTLAQMYLIKAEAEYRKDGRGAAILSAFREGRGYSAGSVASSGEELFAAIRNEYAMEFIGEGRRTADIKRWRVGFARDTQSAADFDKLVANRNAVINGTPTPSTTAVVPANYWGLTLPIPQREFGVNPELRGSQNENY